MGRTGWKRQKENKNTMEHTHTYTRTMIKKMDEWRKRKNVNNDEGRKNHRRQIEKSQRQGQEEIPSQHMRRDHRISRNRAL